MSGANGIPFNVTLIDGGVVVGVVHKGGDHAGPDRMFVVRYSPLKVAHMAESRVRELLPKQAKP